MIYINVKLIYLNLQVRIHTCISCALQQYLNNSVPDISHNILQYDVLYNLDLIISLYSFRGLNNQKFESQLTYQLHIAEPFLRSSPLHCYSGITQCSMKPKALLCSQEPSTGSYPEPDQCNPYHPILSLLHVDLPGGLIPSGFPT